VIACMNPLYLLVTAVLPRRLPNSHLSGPGDRPARWSPAAGGRHRPSSGHFPTCCAGLAACRPTCTLRSSCPVPRVTRWLRLRHRSLGHHRQRPALRHVYPVVAAALASLSFRSVILTQPILARWAYLAGLWIGLSPFPLPVPAMARLDQATLEAGGRANAASRAFLFFFLAT